MTGCSPEATRLPGSLTRTAASMGGTHAKLSASGAYRWLACPGSVRQSEGLPDKPSKYAAEGTAAHDLAAKALETGQRADRYLGKPFSADGFTFVVDHDMAGHVQLYLDYVRNVSDHCKRFVEIDLTPVLKTLHPDLGGIADCVIFDAPSKHLHVIDLKYGAGVLVVVEDNKQLQYYALGALLAMEEQGIKGVTQVTITIVQPRNEGAEPVRSWTFDSFDLLEFATTLVEGAKRTEAEDAPLSPGSHCRWCRAAKTCPALTERTQELAEADYDFDLAPVEIPPEKLGVLLDGLDAVEHRIKAIREYAYEQAVQGNPPVGYKLVAKRATRKWKDTQPVEDMLQGEKNCFTEPALKSVAQVEKALGKKQFKQLCEEHVVAESSGTTLAKASDKRPEVKALASDADDYETVD